jgi:hypothetical protein
MVGRGRDPRRFGARSDLGAARTAAGDEDRFLCPALSIHRAKGERKCETGDPGEGKPGPALGL